MIFYLYPYLRRWSNLTNSYVFSSGCFNHQRVLYVFVQMWTQQFLEDGLTQVAPWPTSLTLTKKPRFYRRKGEDRSQLPIPAQRVHGAMTLLTSVLKEGQQPQMLAVSGTEKLMKIVGIISAIFIIIIMMIFIHHNHTAYISYLTQISHICILFDIYISVSVYSIYKISYRNVLYHQHASLISCYSSLVSDFFSSSPKKGWLVAQEWFDIYESLEAEFLGPPSTMPNVWCSTFGSWVLVSAGCASEIA